MQTIALDDYSIFVGSSWEALQQLIDDKGYTKIAIIVDENTKKYCLPILEANVSFPFELIEVPAGEQHKHIQTCQLIWQKMMEAKLSRSALTINLGGGVIGDMGGFCARTFKRGMDFIQIPTTLLSQVDASIGGKLGIDFLQVKNSVGVFSNPQAVIVDPVFLDTLSPEELRSGFAEVIKHSLIADHAEWQKIKQIDDLAKVDWPAIILPSIQIKRKVVEADPFERGLRKALNFGHTIGHALEGWALETDRRLLHGEAIAIGMVCESYLSKQQGLLDDAGLQEMLDFIKRTYPHWEIPLDKLDIFIQLMKNDKKNEGAEINFSFLPKLGDVKVNQTANEKQIEESLVFYNQLSQVS